MSERQLTPLSFLCGHPIASSNIPRPGNRNYAELRTRRCHLCAKNLLGLGDELAAFSRQCEAEVLGRGLPMLTGESPTERVRADLIRAVHLGFLDRTKETADNIQRNLSGFWAVPHKQYILGPLFECISLFETRFTEWTTCGHWLSFGQRLWLPDASIETMHCTITDTGLLVEFVCADCKTTSTQTLHRLDPLTPQRLSCSGQDCYAPITVHVAPDWFEYWRWYTDRFMADDTTPF